MIFYFYYFILILIIGEKLWFIYTWKMLLKYQWNVEGFSRFLIFPLCCVKVAEGYEDGVHSVCQFIFNWRVKGKRDGKSGEIFYLNMFQVQGRLVGCLNNNKGSLIYHYLLKTFSTFSVHFSLPKIQQIRT
jgi:hypothetical protein